MGSSLNPVSLDHNVPEQLDAHASHGVEHTDDAVRIVPKPKRGR
jgi:hypothetical protein